MSFTASVAVGLAVAGLYVGGRLFAKATLPQERLVVATVAHPAPQSVAPKPSPMQPAVRVLAAATAKPMLALYAPARGISTFIDPKAGETYLQLAALPAGYTERYVSELEAKGIHVSVAPGPSETIFRVVVGPFGERSELVRQRDALAAAGIQPMERMY